MYYSERDANPEFSSLAVSLGWGMSTLTSEGSSLLPATLAGKIVLSLLSVMGIGVIAIPAGIVSAGFLQTMVEEAHEEAALALGAALGADAERAAAIIAGARTREEDAQRPPAAASEAALSQGADAAAAAAASTPRAQPPMLLPRSWATYGTCEAEGGGATGATTPISPPVRGAPTYSRESSRESLASSPAPRGQEIRSRLVGAWRPSGGGGGAGGGGGRAPAILSRRHYSKLDTIGQVRMLSVDGGDGRDAFIVPSLTMQCPHCENHIHLSVGLA